MLMAMYGELITRPGHRPAHEQCVSQCLSRIILTRPLPNQWGHARVMDMPPLYLLTAES
jgi:hypothetical protein